MAAAARSSSNAAAASTTHGQHLFPGFGTNREGHIPPFQPKQLGNVCSDGSICLQER